jgi:gliding motility-associated-like protein
LPTVEAITGTASVCAGSNTQLSSATVGGVWSTSDNAIATVNTIGLVSGVSAGTATISYTVTNTNGCVTITTKDVTVNALPTATINYDGSPYCATGTTTATQSGQTGGTFSSTSGLSIDATTGTIDLSSSTPGAYIVTYSFGNGTCNTTTTASVTINALPTVEAITGTASVCAGSNTQLSSATVGGVWSTSDNAIATVNTIGLVSGVSAGTATISYTVTNTNGCVTITTKDVTVNALPTTTINYDGSPYCATGTTTATQSGQTGGTFSSTSGLSIDATTGTINLSASTPGAYIVTYSFGNGTCNTTTTASVTIYALPTVEAITGTASVCAGSTTQLSSATVGGVWSTSDNAIATVNTTGLVSGVSAGTATISYTVTNTNGCVTTVTKNVTVIPLPEIIKSATAPIRNNDGTFNWFYTLTVVNDTNHPIDSVQIQDNLDEVFKSKGCTYNVVSVIGSGNLIANGMYNGSNLIETLTGFKSIGANTKDSIQIEVRVDTHGQPNVVTVLNQALLSCKVQHMTESYTLNSNIVETPIPVVDIFIPDGFSPNDDNINDKFEITHSQNIKIEFEVYNRWGNSVYKSPDYKNDWDGRGTGNFLGQELPTGTYYCIYKAIDMTTKNVVSKGIKYITLRRNN